MRIHPIALCLGVAFAPGLAFAAHAAEYDVTVLQGLPFAINASGQIVEDSVLWSPSGTATVLGAPAGTLGGSADAINASGWSGGYSLGAVKNGEYGDGGAMVAVGESAGASERGRLEQLRRRHQQCRAERWEFQFLSQWLGHQRGGGAVVVIRGGDGASRRGRRQERRQCFRA